MTPPDGPPGGPGGSTPPFHPNQPARARAHRLWGGRFGGESAPALEALNRSVDIDFRLWPFDVQLSKAWAMALWDAGVLSLTDSRRLEAGLDVVAQRIAAGATPEASDEDVRTMIDRMLTEVVGELGARLHTGRSRNDQVATATRLWCADAAQALDAGVRSVQQVLLDRAIDLQDALMPAYTHLQRAQPVSVAHWLLGHFWPLERDRARLGTAARAALAALPLGSGAVAGSAYPISRVLLKESLGFSGLSPNSVDAVSDRDFVAELLFATTLVATHISRLAEDFILFGTSEFGFVQFGEAYTTGSSMMPQKRNPNVLELARASAGRTLSDLTALLVTLKGLPTGYNKDLQEDKRALFDAVDTLQLVLPAVAGAIGELTFRTERMRAAVRSVLMATECRGLSRPERGDVPRRARRSGDARATSRTRGRRAARAGVHRLHCSAPGVRPRCIRGTVGGALRGAPQPRGWNGASRGAGATRRRTLGARTRPRDAAGQRMARDRSRLKPTAVTRE